ncbi:MAG: Sec-independent protein translocase protein TatB [Gammaproteobacteria bacterium]
MFDVGFWELCLVGLISLLVIGPERLPKAARIAGYWIGKTRNIIAAVKEEIKQELREEEIRQALKEQSVIDEIRQAREDVENAADSFKSTFEQLPGAVDNADKKDPNVGK